jgi:N-methylhydantoinase B
MRGLAGGKDGPPNATVMREGSPKEMVVETTGYEIPFGAGDVLMARFGGGGGWGDPLERDPASVLDDVLDEYVSIESARRDYGVVIDESTMTVDASATRKLRETMANR